MTVGELTERMTAAELMTWMQLPKIDEDLERQANIERLRGIWLT